MNPKPPACADCPWYGDGQGFVPDEIPAESKVVYVCQNPGEVEEASGRPLWGPTGQLLREQWVKVYLPGTAVGYANVVKCRKINAAGRRSNDMPRPAGGKAWKIIVEGCMQRHLRLPPTALIVPCGKDAHLAFTGIDAPVLHMRGTYQNDPGCTTS